MVFAIFSLITMMHHTYEVYIYSIVKPTYIDKISGGLFSLCLDLGIIVSLVYKKDKISYLLSFLQFCIMMFYYFIVQEDNKSVLLSICISMILPFIVGFYSHILMLKEKNIERWILDNAPAHVTKRFQEWQRKL